MLARCVATLKPPPELTLSQWADRYRMLSAESSAEPGRWHTDKAPYQREIMDAIGDAHIRRVVIMCAAQLGKTELLLNILGYFMAYAPAPILVMQPTLDMGQTFSKDRLAPMIRDTPVLRGLVDVKSRYAGNTILKKNFPGGHITIVGANSATGLASRPIKVLLADEVDRYPGSAGTEGDPLSLAQKRQTTFWDKKTVMVSTPVIKGHSRIETEYNQSTREEWNVPCPECGHYQPFVWANLMVAKAKTRYAVNAAGRRHLKDLVQRKKASNSSLLAELHVASMRNDLGYFKTSPAVPTHFTSTGWVQGPSVWKGKVLKANGMRELPGRGNRSKAFLVEFHNKNGNNHIGMVQRVIGSKSEHTRTKRDRPRWRNSKGNVEKLVTLGSPSITAMHHTIWPEVEPSVEEYLQERLQAQVERVLARAGKK